MQQPSGLGQNALQELIDLIQSGRSGEAELRAAQLIARMPNEAALHFLLGMALLTQDRAEGAVASLRQTLQLAPEFPDAAKNLGGALHRLGRLEEAAAVYAEAARRRPGDAGILENFALVLEALDDTEQATKVYAQALAVDPALFLARVNLGVLFARDNRLTEAASHLRTALKVREQATVHMHLGNALRMLGQHQDALTHLARAAALKPQALNYAYLAIAEQESGRANAGTLERIVSLPVSDSDDASMHMWAALALGRPEQAFDFRPAQLNVMDFADVGPLARSDISADVFHLLSLTGTQPVPSPRPLVTAGASGDYAERFAAPLIESVLAHCDADFHLHLVNPGRYDAMAALSRYPEGRVTWSAEEIPGADRVLYSTRRFIRLAQTLRQSGRLIVSLDIDAVARGDFVGALGRDFDALVFARGDMPWAHQMINAGFLALTPGGQEFIDLVAAYILWFEARGAARWYVDQIAMVAARAWLGRHRPELRIGAAPAHVMDWRADSGSLVWHFKGAKKPAG